MPSYLRAVILAFVTLLSCYGASSAAIGAATRPLRLLSADAAVHGPYSELSLTLSESVSYNVYTLANPDRVVIDLPELQVAPTRLPRDVGLITSVRTGRPTPGTARLVVDCLEPPVVDRSRLEPIPSGTAHRLTIALKSSGRSNETSRVLPPVPVGRYATTGGSALQPAPRPAAKSAEASAVTDRSAIRVIAIDPGHGGQDPGAMTSSGVMEKSITLAAARELRDELKKVGRYKVVLTRNRDVFIRLRDRIAIARKAGADAMISIHANKMADPSIRGFSVYTLSESASDAEAAALAESENKADLITHLDLRGATPDVTNILIDIAQRETMNSAARLASLVVSQVRRDTPLLPKPHRFAGFAVLKAPDVPSILVELGFLSNQEDTSALTSARGRRKLISAFARAIDAYFSRVEMANSR